MSVTGTIAAFTDKFGGGVKIDGKFYNFTDKTIKYKNGLYVNDTVEFDFDAKKNLLFIRKAGPIEPQATTDGMSKQMMIIAEKLDTIISLIVDMMQAKKEEEN